MGILDDAIRDHLDLKRRGGAEEGELKELEDEAFGPPGRPQPPGMEQQADATQVAAEVTAPETASDAVELGEQARNGHQEGAAAATEAPPSDEPIFHDLAAEEGLVGASESRAELEAPPGEAPPGEERPGEDPSEERGDEPPAEAPGAEPGAEPVQEPPAQLEDTQVHDMESELGLDAGSEEGESDTESGAEAEGDGEPVGEIQLEELDLELDEDEEPEADEQEPGDDVLEETPDFLRDTPESDRLWFEQGKPKDFDFDDEEK